MRLDNAAASDIKLLISWGETRPRNSIPGRDLVEPTKLVLEDHHIVPDHWVKLALRKIPLDRCIEYAQWIMMHHGLLEGLPTGKVCCAATRVATWRRFKGLMPPTTVAELEGFSSANKQNSLQKNLIVLLSSPYRHSNCTTPSVTWLVLSRILPPWRFSSFLLFLPKKQLISIFSLVFSSVLLTRSKAVSACLD